MSDKIFGECNTTNSAVLAWVETQAKLCGPEKIFWCDGSAAEKQFLTEQAIAAGVLIRLNQEKLPGCYYHRSNSNDVARVEQCTFICTETEEEAGRTNNCRGRKAVDTQRRA